LAYPITPQNEIWNGSRVACRSWVAHSSRQRLNWARSTWSMGAACTGARVMTSSSSPGISLMMEGCSYIAGTEIPMVLVNVMRGGPGLGNIAPSKVTTTKICKRWRSWDYHPIVLAPASVQEAVT